MWTQWINGILGLWIIVASWTYMSSGIGRTLLIITGIIVAVLGFFGGATMPSSRHTTTNT